MKKTILMATVAAALTIIAFCAKAQGLYDPQSGQKVFTVTGKILSADKKDTITVTLIFYATPDVLDKKRVRFISPCHGDHMVEASFNCKIITENPTDPNELNWINGGVLFVRAANGQQANRHSTADLKFKNLGSKSIDTIMTARMIRLNTLIPIQKLAISLIYPNGLKIEKVFEINLEKKVLTEPSALVSTPGTLLSKN